MMDHEQTYQPFDPVVPRSYAARILRASIIRFPLSHRTSFVERHGEIISGMTQKSAERHLAHQLKVQREALERRGVDTARIGREIASLERAILAAMWESPE